MSPGERQIMARWPSWVNMFLGAWLVVAPYVLGYADVPRASLNSVLVGIAVVGIAAARAYIGAPPWTSWLNLMLGIWLVVSPMGLAFATSAVAAWTHVLTGIVIAGLAVAATFAVAPGGEPEFASAEPPERGAGDRNQGG